MIPIKFPEMNNQIAKNQPEYKTLPAKIDQDVTISVWEFSPEEIEKIKKGEKLYLAQLNFGTPLQPVKLLISDKLPKELGSK